MNAPTSPDDSFNPAEIRSILFGILLTMLLASMDVTITGPALPTIGRELGDIGLLSWIVTAYLLTATAVTPLYGKLSDIHGRRVMMLIALGIFVLGSVACALAPSVPLLVAARAFQGLGGGGLMSLSQTITGDIVPPVQRPRYQVYFATMYASSSLAGPVLGGFFAQHLHWSLIFWINVPLGAVALALSWTKLRTLPAHHRPHRLDLAGAALMIGATVTIMLALSWGGTRYAWLSPAILSLVAASVLLWTLFALRLATASEPLIPIAVLKNRVVLATTLAGGFAMGTHVGLTIYVPVYLETVVGLSASQSGLALLPLTVSTVIGAILTGRAMNHMVHYKRPAMAGLVVAMAMLLMLANIRDLPIWSIELLLMITAIGTGMVFSLTSITTQNAVPVHQLGTAMSNQTFFRQFGGAMIVAIFGALMLAGGVSPHAKGAIVAPGADAMVAAHAFEWIFTAAAIGLALSLLGIAAMPELPLRRRVSEPDEILDEALAAE